jgi:hypothetical protein
MDNAVAVDEIFGILTELSQIAGTTELVERECHDEALVGLRWLSFEVEKGLKAYAGEGHHKTEQEKAVEL